jgi:hypothetical protein
VSEQLGDFRKAGTAAQQSSCNGVAQAMRPERRNTCPDGSAADYSADGLPRKAGEWGARSDK